MLAAYPGYTPKGFRVKIRESRSEDFASNQEGSPGLVLSEAHGTSR